MRPSDRLVSQDWDSILDAPILSHPRHSHPHPGRQSRVQICPAHKADRDRKCVPRCIEIACSAYLQSVAFPRPAESPGPTRGGLRSGGSAHHIGYNTLLDLREELKKLGL